MSHTATKEAAAVIVAALMLFAGGLCSGSTTPPVAGYPDCRARPPAAYSSPVVVWSPTGDCATPWRLSGSGGAATCRTAAGRQAIENLLVATVRRQGDSRSVQDIWSSPHTAVLLRIRGLPGRPIDGRPRDLMVLILIPPCRGAAA